MAVSLRALCTAHTPLQPLLLQPPSLGSLQTALGLLRTHSCFSVPGLSASLRVREVGRRPAGSSLVNGPGMAEWQRGVYGSNSSAELQRNEGARVNYPSVCVSAALNYRICC